jgi:hypothetical protein
MLFIRLALLAIFLGQTGSAEAVRSVRHHGRNGKRHTKVYHDDVPVEAIQRSVKLASRLRKRFGRNKNGEHIVPVVHHVAARKVEINHRDGRRFRDLSPRAQTRARMEMRRYGEIGRQENGGRRVDAHGGNFTFYSNGEIRAWFDQMRGL